MIRVHYTLCTHYTLPFFAKLSLKTYLFRETILIRYMHSTISKFTAVVLQPA